MYIMTTRGKPGQIYIQNTYIVHKYKFICTSFRNRQKSDQFRECK